MGMRVGGSSSVASGQGVSTSPWQQQQQNVKDLMSALSTGDMATAQKAYASLSSANGSINPSSPLGQIGQALQSGNLPAAQQAAQSMQAARSGGHQHGHHGHHGGAAPVAATTTAATTTPPSGTGALINLTA